MKNEKKGSFLGLLPLIVFLVAYMGTGLGTGSFDNMPHRIRSRITVKQKR